MGSDYIKTQFCGLYIEVGDVSSLRLAKRDATYYKYQLVYYTSLITRLDNFFFFFLIKLTRTDFHIHSSSKTGNSTWSLGLQS